MADRIEAALERKLAALEPRRARRGPLSLTDPDNRSLRPYELGDALRPAVELHGMYDNLREMEEKGYTVLTGCFTAEECDRLVAAVQRTGSGNHLLGKQPEFEVVPVHPKMAALAEYMCGAGCLLSQFAASIQQQNKKHSGMPKVGLHSDQNWTPAPFPEHNQLLTCCVAASDDYTLENGATCLVPGSHKLRRHPNQLEQQNCARLVEPVVARRGDVVCWDGSVWHTAGVRQAPGERVVFHVTYCRVFMSPLENYDDITDASFAGKPYAALLRRLLARGREMDGIFRIKETGRDMTQFHRLTEMARGTYDEGVFERRLDDVQGKVKEMLASGKKLDPATKNYLLNSLRGRNAHKAKI